VRAALGGVHVELVLGGADAERHDADKADGADTGERRNPVAELGEELRGLVVRVVLDLGVDGHDQQVGRFEPDIDGGGIAEAAEKEAGGGEKHEG